MGNDGPDYSNVAAGGQVNVTHPLHVEQHEDGGEDEINLEGLSGSPADVGDASEATLAELKDRIGDETNPATGTSNKQLADILTQLGTLLTELQLKADLTETQPVSAASLPLPTSAATAANQGTEITALQSIQNLVGALHDVGIDELDVFLAGQTVDIEVKQQTPGDLMPGVHGWDGSAWKKLPLLWGYSESYREVKSSTNADEGDNLLIGSTVPAGEVWIVNSICVYNIISAMTRVELQIYDGLISTYLDFLISPAQYETLTVRGNFILTQDDRVYVKLVGCTAGDDIFLDIFGYKMKIAE